MNSIRVSKMKDHGNAMCIALCACCVTTLLRVFNEHMLLAGGKNWEPDIICILLCFRFSDLYGIVLCYIRSTFVFLILKEKNSQNLFFVRKKQLIILKLRFSNFILQLHYDVAIPVFALKREFLILGVLIPFV